MRHRFYILLVFLLPLILFSCSDNKDRAIWIARDASWYPINTMGKGDNLLGFTDDLLTDIAQQKNLKIEVLTGSVNEEIEGLQDGRFAGIISMMTPNSTSQQMYIFSEPLYAIGPVLVVQSSSEIKQLSDMKGKIVGVETGSPFIFSIEKYPNISVTPYENIMFALENLSKGQIDGVIMDSIAADIYTSSFYKGRLEIVSGILSSGGIRLVVMKNDEGEELIANFNEGLHFLQESGKYKNLLEKWSLYIPK